MSKLETLQDKHGSDDMDEVEMEKQQPGSSIVFIESASYTGLIVTFAFCLLFEAAYIYTGFNSPPLIHTTTVTYPLVQEYSNKLADIRIELSPLSHLSRFIRMDTYFQRYSNSDASTLSVETVRKIKYLKGINTIHVGNEVVSQSTISFGANEENSTFTKLFQQPITNEFDSMDISIQIKSDLRQIKAFTFRYIFNDPNLTQFTNSVRILLFISILYSYVGFLICLRSGVYSNFQYYAIVLGAVALIATNPFVAFIDNEFLHSLSPILISVFLAVFRIFASFLFYSIAYSTESLSNFFIGSNVAFNVVYMIIEAISGYQNYSLFANITDDIPVIELGTIDYVLMAFHVGYIIYSIILLIQSFKVSGENQHFKSTAYGLFFITCLIALFVIELSKESQRAKILLLISTKTSLTQLILTQSVLMNKFILIILKRFYTSFSF